MSYIYNSGSVIGNTNVGGIIGGYAIQDSGLTVSDCYYKSGCALTAIGGFLWSSGTRENIGELETLPSVIEVINGDNAFVVDTNNINKGYPILAWQVKNN